MGKMRIYTGEEVTFTKCPACAYARHEFVLPCGVVYEDDLFMLSQDWELPIPGFLVLSPKRCVEKLSDLTDYEREEMFKIVDKTIKLLRNSKICDRFDVIFEEKIERHFHIWIMPREKWMTELVGDIIDHIGDIFSYAKSNNRTNDNLKKIKEVTDIIKNQF